MAKFVKVHPPGYPDVPFYVNVGLIERATPKVNGTILIISGKRVDVAQPIELFTGPLTDDDVEDASEVDTTAETQAIEAKPKTKRGRPAKGAKKEEQE